MPYVRKDFVLDAHSLTQGQQFTPFLLSPLHFIPSSTLDTRIRKTGDLNI